MDTSARPPSGEPRPSTPTRVFDGFYRKQGRKTKQATFKVYEEDFIKLKADYPENMALVIRILLEQFILGNLPEVETKLKQLLEQNGA